MKQNNLKKTTQIGMPIGTASAILRKNILFEMLQRHNENICFQCKEAIESVDELSIEHKVPYLDSENPQELFFDLQNIAFSHLRCNIKASRTPVVIKKHPSTEAYKQGCRCSECRNIERLRRTNQRRRGIKT